MRNIPLSLRRLQQLFCCTCTKRQSPTHHVGGQPAKIFLLLSWGAQFADQRVNQCVLDVAEHSHGRVHLGQLLDDKDGREEGGAGAAILWVDLNAHEL